MKKITLISFITIFLVSCGNSHRAEYISDCLSKTPGGSSYKDMCTCIYDGGVELMSSEEKTAMLRDFAEIQDAKYMLTVPTKFFASTMKCQDIPGF